jgi:Rps23 Pro-64 3,4-dihydroxylase Tpa1-like proline 4-hydroxylase
MLLALPSVEPRSMSSASSVETECPAHMRVSADARCPHVVFARVFGPERVAALLDYVEMRHEDFQPARVRRRASGEKTVDTQRRNHLQLRGLGAFEDALGGFVRSIKGRMLDALHLGEPAIEPREFDLIAYRDGDYFRAHVDTSELTHTVRVLSCVYYFAATPPRFTGGALRLHGFPKPSIDGRRELTPYVDVPPETDTLVAFPAWLRHEVLPVHVPAGAWRDSRFAINCWLHRVRPSADDAPARP